jgi:hypothetical protein
MDNFELVDEEGVPTKTPAKPSRQEYIKALKTLSDSTSYFVVTKRALKHALIALRYNPHFNYKLYNVAFDEAWRCVTTSDYTAINNLLYAIMRNDD